MVDLRLYRLAFLPFVLALIYVAFSLAPRPRPFTSTLAPDAFDGASALGTLDSLRRDFASRRPGSPGDARLAQRVADGFGAANLTTTTRSFTGDTVAGRRTLLTVIGRRQGNANGALVIVAHRDSRAGGSPAELSGTATLLELARIFANRVIQRTLILVSTSGGSGGAAGAADLARRLRDPIDAVLVIGDIAGSRSRRPYVVPWSDGSQIAPIRLRRTVETAMATQLGRSPGGTAASDQLVRLAFPLTVGEQGPFGAADLPAVMVQQSGEAGPQPADAASGPPATQRLQDFGRGVLRAINALDTAPDVGPPTRDILLGARVLPGWGIRLLAALLILPGLAAAVDLLARMRRRRVPVAPGFTWLAVTAAPFALAGLFAVALGRTGLLAAAPSGPVIPSQLPLSGTGRGAIVSVAIVFGLAWLARPTLHRRFGSSLQRSVVGMPAALFIAGCGLLVVTWLANPYAALLGVLPLHLWLLATTLEPAPPRGAGAALVAGALLPLLALSALYSARLGLGPSGFAWSGLLMVAGGHIGIPALALWSLAGSCVIAALTIVAARARERDEAEPEVTVRGPIGYAGPGSLGGTDSALRR